MELHHRILCVGETVEQYLGSTFEWGKRDCVKMTATHLRRMGHSVSFVKGGEYSSPVGARRALKRMGFDSVEAAMDSRFFRIEPAAAWPGDVIALPSEVDLFPAMAICLPNNAILHTLGGGFAISEPKAFVAAWRIPYLGECNG